MSLAIPRLRVDFSSGAIEALKWVAFAAMAVDHINAIFYDRSLSWAAPIGRIAMPLFAVVLAYNLARPQVDAWRLARKLKWVGIACLPVTSLLLSQGFGWWPLNILLTFSLGAYTIGKLQDRRWLSAAVWMLVGGFFVDYLWVGPAMIVAGWWFFSERTRLALACFAGTFAALCAYSGNPWPLLALPVLYAAMITDPVIPRIRSWFWWAYPAHLVVLGILQRLG